MFLHARSRSVKIEGTTMDYAVFGQGTRPLIILPGLSEAFSGVKGKARALAWSCRAYGRDFRVFVFGRKNDLFAPYSTRDMARDQAAAMDALGLKNAAVLGISQGGMIAQHLAALYPHLVSRLALAVTLAQPGEELRSALENWISLAEKKEYAALMTDTAKRSYSPAFLKKYRYLYPFLGFFGKPEDFSRFLIQARACLSHTSQNELDRIVCPVLILGGECDQIAGPQAALDLSFGIEKSRLFIYPGLGHGLYEEAKDFHQRVLAFLKE